MKISIKLFMGFSIIIILITLSGGIYIYLSRQALIESIGGNSVLLAEETLNKVDRDIYSKIEQINLHFEDLMIKEIILESNKEFDSMENPEYYINEKDKEWTSSNNEITPFMEEIFNTKLSKNLNLIIDYYEKKYGYKVFGEIFLTNKYGANIAQTGKTSDYYQADEEWWQNAKEKGAYVGDVEYDKSAGVYSLDICTRIEDEDKEFLGVTKAALNIEEITTIIKELEEKAAEEAEELLIDFHLINKEGKIIFALGEKEQHEILEDVSDKSFFKRIMNNKGDKNYFVALGDHSDEGKNLFSYAYSQGHRDYKGSGWILVLEHSTEKIFAPITQLTIIMIITALITIILAFLINFFISKTITKPLHALHKGTEQIEKGDLNLKVGTNTKDELGQLSRSFDKMAQSLKKSRQQIKNQNIELEKKVNQRTKELELKSKEYERMNKFMLGRENEMVKLKKQIKKEKLKGG